MFAVRPANFRIRTAVLAAFMALLFGACAQADGLDTAFSRSPNPDLKFGAYTYGGVWGGMQPVLELETAIGRRLDIVHWFMSFDNEWDSNLVAPLGASGRLPLISWQPSNVSVASIAAGAQDEYIRSWAVGAAEYGQPVYLRPFPEMNGNWTSWNGDPDNLVIAWRRMVDIFTAEGAHNVSWVWSPNVLDEPRTEANRMEHYYPGAAYVDVLALDGYNWGQVRGYIGWQSFAEILELGYSRITALGGQPLWMAETASAELGGNKGQWVVDMFADSVSYPRLDAIVWFNENKETDWRINSSAATLASFQDVLPHLGGELAASER